MSNGYFVISHGWYSALDADKLLVQGVNALQLAVFLHYDGHVDLRCSLGDHLDVDVPGRQAREHARGKTGVVLQILTNHADCRSVVREPQPADFPKFERCSLHLIAVDGFADGHTDAGVCGADEVDLHFILGDDVEHLGEENAVLMLAVVEYTERRYLLFAADGRDAARCSVELSHFRSGLGWVDDRAPARGFEGVENMHWHLTLDETVHRQWVQHLVAEVGELQRFSRGDASHKSEGAGG